MPGWGAALAKHGRYGDTEMAHINDREAKLLYAFGGAGTRNPATGLPEFYADNVGFDGKAGETLADTIGAGPNAQDYANSGWNAADNRIGGQTDSLNAASAGVIERTLAERALGVQTRVSIDPTTGVYMEVPDRWTGGILAPGYAIQNELFGGKGLSIDFLNGGQPTENLALSDRGGESWDGGAQIVRDQPPPETDTNSKAQEEARKERLAKSSALISGVLPATTSAVPTKRSERTMAGWGSILSKYGRFGDNRMAHVNPGEAMLMKQLGGAGTRNPVTGALEFFTNAEAQDIFKDTIGREASASELAAWREAGVTSKNLGSSLQKTDEYMDRWTGVTAVRNAFGRDATEGELDFLTAPSAGTRSKNANNLAATADYLGATLKQTGADAFAKDVEARIPGGSYKAPAAKTGTEVITQTGTQTNDQAAPGWATALQEAISGITSALNGRPQAVPQILETPGVVSTPQNSARSGVPGVVSSGGARTLRGVVNRRTGQIEYTPVMGDAYALDPVFRNQRRGGWANSIQF